MNEYKDEPDAPLDAFHHHEVLHTVSIIAGMFEEHIVEHRYTRADPNRLAEAERISALLWDFYQRVGGETGPGEQPLPAH